MLVSPEYCTGRQLWRLAMPSTLSPADPAWVQGQIGLVTHTGTGLGQVGVADGGPTDTYQITIEILTTGGPGAATFRWRLQDTDPWSLAVLVPDDGLWPQSTSVAKRSGFAESGLALRFTATALQPFQAGDLYQLPTVESPQQADLRRAVSDEIERKIKPRGGQPARDWDVGLAELAAQKVAYRLGRIRGFDPRAAHDQQLLRGEKHANSELRRIMEEIEQADIPGQDTIPGVDCASQPPQGAELW